MTVVLNVLLHKTQNGILHPFESVVQHIFVVVCAKMQVVEAVIMGIFAGSVVNASITEPAVVR